MSVVYPVRLSYPTKVGVDSKPEKIYELESVEYDFKNNKTSGKMKTGEEFDLWEIYDYETKTYISTIARNRESNKLKVSGRISELTNKPKTIGDTASDVQGNVYSI